MDVIAGVVTGIVAVAVIAIGNAIVTRKRREQQQKVDSARLVWEICEYWSETKYPESAKFINDLYAIKAKADDPQTRKFLSHLEHLAILWKEETILEDHVKEFFWPDLKTVQKNLPIKDRIYQKYEQDHHTYANLIKLLEKSKEW